MSISDDHKTVPVQVWVDVDEGVADLVRRLNDIEGVRTRSSCQGTVGEGGPEPYPGYVTISWDRAEALITLQREFQVNIDSEGEGWVAAIPEVRRLTCDEY